MYADWEYIKDYEKFAEQVKRFERAFVEDGIEQEKTKSAINGIKAGFDNQAIATFTGLSIDQIEHLRDSC